MTVAEVRIWGNVIGYVSWEDKSRASSFEFEKKFLQSSLDISPLSMPLGKVNPSEIYKSTSISETDYQTYKGLQHFLTDSLPDAFGNSIIEAWLATQGRKLESFNPVERLCYTGKRGIGALEYYPAINVVDDISATVNIEKLVKLSEKILYERKKFKVDLMDGEAAITDIIRVGTSAGGARPKAVIAYNERTHEIRSGQVDAPDGFSHWILKIDGVRETGLGQTKDVGRIEYAYHLMAKDCEIKMSDCMLLEEGGRAHFMTRRFDRTGNEKLHMQSLNAMSGINYRLTGTYSYEQVFTELMRLRLSYQEIEQMFRRMVFNVVSRNCDDHSKNIAFLMGQNGKWSLSPAYDVCYAYDPAGRFNFQHFLSVNGKFNDIAYKDISEVGAKIGLKNRSIIVEQVIDTVSRWSEYAHRAGVDKIITKGIGSVHQTQIGVRDGLLIRKRGFDRAEIPKSALQALRLKLSDISQTNTNLLLSGKKTNPILAKNQQGESIEVSLQLIRNKDNSVSISTLFSEEEKTDKNIKRKF